mgnify:CR=1 FL=1
MTSMEKRVEKLERATGTGDVPGLVVIWDDGIEVDRERLTVEEFKARYPDAVVVEWPDE